MAHPSHISVLFRILTGIGFTMLLLYFLISWEERKRDDVNQSHLVCGYYVEHYEHRSSRGVLSKYLKVKNNNLIETYLITYKTTGLNDITKGQAICLSYYYTLFHEKSTLHIKSKH